MCGMTREEDIDHAISLGVDAIGFIFYNKSARYVTVTQVKALLKRVPAFVDAVAVMVNPEPQFVKEIIDELPIQYLQFHGDETVDFCEQFKFPYIKAIQPNNSQEIITAMAEYQEAKAILLDTPSSSHRGGTGKAFDWQIIPEVLAKPYILAGGLNELNVQEAMMQCHPFAVDVCSGIEALPGVKDHSRMSKFIKSLWGTR